MKRQLFTLAAAVCFPYLAGATVSTWINNGTLTFPPQIDATNMVNNGTMGTFSTSLPFDTSNTQNFTNNGAMSGSVGFRFDTAPRNSSGVLIAPRRPARNFFNRIGATVTSVDGFLPNFAYTGSYLWIDATNIVNQGTLTAGAAGEIKLSGTNVNLTRSGLQIGSIQPRGSGNGETNFFPDNAIYDLFWAQTNMTFDSSQILTFFGTNMLVLSPPFDILPWDPPLTYQIGFLNPINAAYSNFVGGTTLTITNIDGSTSETNVVTNFVRQAVFVEVNNRTNVGVSITFGPSSYPTNRFRSARVNLTIPNTNAVTQSPELNTISFLDTLASEPERGLRFNINDGTYRPANYILSRIPLSAGSSPNVFVTTNFFHGRDFADPVVTGEYSGYGAEIDNVTSRPPFVPGGTVTNMPGRVRIIADNLDMSRARIRGEGLVSLQVRNTIESSNAVVDCENLSFNLTSTTGNLRVQNLMKESVARLRGDVYAWSGLWTNSITQLIENYVIDEEEGTATLEPVTNIINVSLHALLLDAQVLLTALPVLVHDFRAISDNVVINDSGSVVQNFFVQGTSLTVNGSLNLTGVLYDWVVTNAPNLLYFTNTGSFNIPNEAHFGDDRPSGYLTFINRGAINTYSANIRSAYVENGGQINAPGSVVIDAESAKLENGGIDVGYDVSINAAVLRLNRQIINADIGSLYLLVTNTLADTGGGASNVVTVHSGFHLPVKPAFGDLLGTRFVSSPLLFAESVHTWAGEDRGATVAGFSNNAAIGQLALSVGYDSLLTFAGASTTPGETNALYVDYLELDASVAGNLAATLNIAPNLIIYFANANVPVETLDGQFNGRLRWVRNFAGPNSSVPVVINGVVVMVNRALRESLQIDSDADGLANGYDPSPFDPVVFTVTPMPGPPPYAVISWRAAVDTIYTVEWATNFALPAWQWLLTTNNPWPTNANISVRDPDPMGPGPRFYRVYYTP